MKSFDNTVIATLSVYIRTYSQCQYGSV